MPDPRVETGENPASPNVTSLDVGHSGGAAPPEDDLNEQDVLIRTRDGLADAWVVHPAVGAHPGIIIWTDALGLRTAYRLMGRRLAKQGYGVAVMNPYYRTQQGPVGLDPRSMADPAVRERVQTLAGAITAEMAKRDALSLVEYLDGQPWVDSARKLGTAGYCMGGAVAILTAATAPDRVGAVASFHGAKLITSEPSSPHLAIPKTGASALIAVAEDDDAKDPEAKIVLGRAFAAAGWSAEIEVYAGAMHGWCPSDTAAFNEPMAELAWSRLLALLARAVP